jgi:hypothetical protein
VVEQGNHNPLVGSSNLSVATKKNQAKTTVYVKIPLERGGILVAVPRNKSHAFSESYKQMRLVRATRMRQRFERRWDNTKRRAKTARVAAGIAFLGPQTVTQPLGGLTLLGMNAAIALKHRFDPGNMRPQLR